MKNTYTSLTDLPFPDTTQLERQVVADAVVSPENLDETARLVDASLFIDADLAKAWTILCKMHDNGEHIDLSTAVNKCGPWLFSKIGGLMDGFTNTACFAHAAAFYNTATRRRTYQEAFMLMQKATDPGQTADDMEAAADSLRENLRCLRPTDLEKKLTNVIEKVAETFADRQEKALKGTASLCPSGFVRLDRHTNGGWEEGQLIIIAARPSVGKTAIMLQMAETAARSGFPACIFSMEMTDEQLGRRYLMDNKGRLTSREINTGLTKNADEFWDGFNAAASRFSNLPIYVNDTSRNLDEIISRISLNVRRGRCRVAFLDYLGFIQDDSNSNLKLYQRIAVITGALKQAAKRLRIPIVLLCQLNRESAKTNRPPELYDLRDSGSIEQDADVVLMLEHDIDDHGEPIIPELTAEERIEIMNAQLAGEALIPELSPFVNMWVRKNRNGRKNFVVKLRPSLYYSHFEDIETNME